MLRRTTSDIDGRLLQVLAEHMKLPLLQVARHAELARLTGDTQAELDAIELTADTALRLLDNYLLSNKLARQRGEIELEPVALSAILTDTAQKLAKLAAQNQCVLEVHLSGRYEPVLAHRVGLEAALISLGYVFIEAQAGLPAGTAPVVIKLAAHRGKNGIVAGLFTNNEGFSVDVFRRAHELYGHARQAMPELLSGSGAGVFVADSLLDTMSSGLRIARHQQLNGLGATFAPSRQLQLI
jgi:hypothetical protein